MPDGRTYRALKPKGLVANKVKSAARPVFAAVGAQVPEALNSHPERFCYPDLSEVRKVTCEELKQDATWASKLVHPLHHALAPSRHWNLDTRAAPASASV